MRNVIRTLNTSNDLYSQLINSRLHGCKLWYFNLRLFDILLLRAMLSKVRYSKAAICIEANQHTRSKGTLI